MRRLYRRRPVRQRGKVERARWLGGPGLIVVLIFDVEPGTVVAEHRRGGACSARAGSAGLAGSAWPEAKGGA